MTIKQIILFWLLSITILIIGMSWSQYYGYQKGFHDGFITKQSTKVDVE
jgi:hypothetical protein